MTVRHGVAAWGVVTLGLVGVWAAPAGAAAPAARQTITGNVPGWATPAHAVGKVPGSTRLEVRVALRWRHEASARRLAVAVSDPTNPKHGRFLTEAEFLHRFAPTAAQVSRVRGWLTGAGMTVTGVSTNRHFVSAQGSTRAVRAAFGTGLSVYRWRGRLLRGPSGPLRVPASVAGAVSAVLGLDDSAALAHPDHLLAGPIRRADHLVAPDSAAAAAGAGADQQCAQWWGQHNNTAVPQVSGLQSNAICGYAGTQIQHLYGVGGPDQNGAGRSVAVVDAYASPTMRTDLDHYDQIHGLPALTAGQYTESLADDFVTDPNCESPSTWAIEEALDTEAVHTAAPAANITYVGTRSCLTLFDGLNRAVDGGLGDIVSNSWGMHGEDVPAATRRQADAIFVEAALKGITVVFSTGDAGDNQGNPLNGHPQPDWPASSPWVTAVGGTSTGINDDDSIRFQTGWESQIDSLNAGGWAALPPPVGPFAGGSGGGPSHLYAEPSWQDHVVPAGLSGGHRVVPDIAALADPNTGFAVGLSINGVFSAGAVGGTSLACPLIAAILADAGQVQHTRLGLATPALYQAAGGNGLRDVTDVHAAVYTPQGPTAGGDFLWETDRPTQTLQAGPGFDPVTGLGVPGPALLTQLGR